MSIAKIAAALVAAATLAGAAAPAYAQFGATTMPNIRVDATSGGWINSPNRDFYTPSTTGAATDDYASTECTLARVPYSLADGTTVTRLRHVCP